MGGRFKGGQRGAPDIQRERNELTSRLEEAGLSERTTKELSRQVQGSTGIFALQQKFERDLLSGKDTPLRRRENLRLRAEQTQKRPGLRGLLSG